MVGSIILIRKFKESKIWHSNEIGINKPITRVKIKFKLTMRVQFISLTKGKSTRGTNRKIKMESNYKFEQVDVSNKKFWDSRVDKIRVIELEVK